MTPSNNTIVTAADAYYFRNMCQFIYTFKSQKEYKNSRLICYDLGFDEEQLSYFEKLKSKVPNISIRKFDFEAYPDFVALSYKTYSFKPIIINMLMGEIKGNIFWLDSATILRQSLDEIWNTLDERGSFTPHSGTGTLKDWTVQETLDYMNVPTEYYSRRNFSGGVCGFSYNNEHLRKLVSEWERYALIQECIKPKGADRSNHRDDQSLLTILLYTFQDKYGIKLTKEEVNISSTKPSKYLTVMNKLKPTFPQGLDFFSVSYFNIYSKLDILINRLKS